jgi:hypothetical protein
MCFVDLQTGVTWNRLHNHLHPHGDPYDNFDLATVFAMASQGRLDLRGIVIPPTNPEAA